MSERKSLSDLSEEETKERLKSLDRDLRFSGNYGSWGPVAPTKTPLSHGEASELFSKFDGKFKDLFKDGEGIKCPECGLATKGLSMYSCPRNSCPMFLKLG